MLAGVLSAPITGSSISVEVEGRWIEDPQSPPVFAVCSAELAAGCGVPPFLPDRENYAVGALLGLSRVILTVRQRWISQNTETTRLTWVSPPSGWSRSQSREHPGYSLSFCSGDRYPVARTVNASTLIGSRVDSRFANRIPLRIPLAFLSKPGRAVSRSTDKVRAQTHCPSLPIQQLERDKLTLK